MENNNVSTIDKYRTAMELFNANPTGNQAQNYLVEQGLISADTIDYEFTIILNTYATHVDKTALGKYLGHKGNGEKCRAYIQTVNVNGLHIDEALRKFLGKFKLPGEAQDIDRIMELFAAEYIRQNPEYNIYETEQIHILCFGIIMLNSDLHHNPQPVKMTREQFIQTVATSSANGFTPGFLGAIYDRVVATAIM